MAITGAAVVGGLISGAVTRNASKRAAATQRQNMEKQEQMQAQEIAAQRMQAAPASKISAAAPPVMPSTDMAAVQNAKKQSISAQIARRGRASTILTGGGGNQNETLGG
jgi:hypothetical protein